MALSGLTMFIISVKKLFNFARNETMSDGQNALVSKPQFLLMKDNTARAILVDTETWLN